MPQEPAQPPHGTLEAAPGRGLETAEQVRVHPDLPGVGGPARLELEDGVRELGLWVAESDANFVWVRLPEADAEDEVVAGLRDRGVLVRAGASLGRPGALRVTVGTPEENARFVAALAELKGHLGP